MQYGLNEGVNGVAVTCVCFVGNAVGNNHAHGEGFVTEKGRKSGDGATFHFEIGDDLLASFERHDFVILLRVGKWQTERSALRPVKTATGNGHTANHICLRNSLSE